MNERKEVREMINNKQKTKVDEIKKDTAYILNLGLEVIIVVGAIYWFVSMVI